MNTSIVHTIVWRWLPVLGLLLLRPSATSLQHTEGFFNATSSVTLQSGVDLRGHTGLSFRTCSGGELFHKDGRTGSISLRVGPDGLLLAMTLHKSTRTEALYELKLPAKLLDNTWHAVNLLHRLGNLTLSVAGHMMVVANSTYNSDVLANPSVFNDTLPLYVGREFRGCILQGPSIVFQENLQGSHNVEWDSCPLNGQSCTLLDHCSTEPCLQHGRCVSGPDRYECHCAARYIGNNCEVDNGPPCERNGTSPCLHSGLCQEDQFGNYTCTCDSGHTGQHCETEISQHLCESNPCKNNGSCRVLGDRYECTCLPGFTGRDCEDNILECLSAPCQNGGTCVDGINNYTCLCHDTGYKSTNCDVNIDECENNPCLNGKCFDTYGDYICQCNPGFGGNNCEQKINECSSGPCRHGGRCTDLVGSYQCQCVLGYAGANCERSLNSCESLRCSPNADCVENHATGTFQCVCQPGFMGVNCTEIALCTSTSCLNGGTCNEHFTCTCLSGFTGVNCEHPLSDEWCMAMPCENGGTCNGLDGCVCLPGFGGPACEMHVIHCSDNPCSHSSQCMDNIENDSYVCNCIPGWTGMNCDTCTCDMPECLDSSSDPYCECPPGSMCQNSLTDWCSSNPCQNVGVCVSQRNGYICNCTEEFMGDNCEQGRELDACRTLPCLNNGTCMPRTSRGVYDCNCLPGFTGKRCDINVVDCQNTCPENKVCVSTTNGIECHCLEGYTDPNCAEDINECAESKNLCNHGICRNTVGSYQCFCQPGYSGDNCDIDFDECLSKPCYNGATCDDRINGYTCTCPPGYTGMDCKINIEECLSNPCASGATCQDGIASYICICPTGLTGNTCETNIDDCESMPCINGVCEDGLNSFTCNCSGTGFYGERCENNIDDCATGMCMNGAVCNDLINDYECSCYSGYTGKNCEKDENECESSPCQNGGTCLQHSNRSLYWNYDSPHFQQDFNYSIASGYECICVLGTDGENCENNFDDCKGNPCGPMGKCSDKINGYECECHKGFEGLNCSEDINECERYKPCGEHGKCHDQPGDFECECNAKYGGKNCTVELTGCHNDSCSNNGTCTPYLVNETEHKFNCSCPNGFHGERCEKVTTMSMTDKSLVKVVTRREEGYDIKFRFKTTLPNCLLAIGKGLTYYSLELFNGRLNLHSSLLNKLEGVFIGSDLANGTKWQKVFVQINSSHVVLAANEEQTIHPINQNEVTNVSHTSFQYTYLGTAIPELRSLAHVPTLFVGCMEDVVVNGEAVIPRHMPPNSTTVSVQEGCPRKPQCDPNPCHNDGLCTDQWSDFKCACERPYLGHTCQYNMTAATFGHENMTVANLGEENMLIGPYLPDNLTPTQLGLDNVTGSVVVVRIKEQPRSLIRHIVDISMFIRTHREKGAIFYMSSLSGQDESVIAAQLEGSELFVRILLNGTLESYTVGSLKLNDGNRHLIQVIRNVTLVQVKINGTEYFRKTISANGQLDVNYLYLGAFPTYMEGSQSRLNSIRCDANFKGVIQDVQVASNSTRMSVEFFPLLVPELGIPRAFGEVYFNNLTVLEGVISDNSCFESPCEHDGNCSITWNDFKCTCKRGFRGKRCQEMEFCQLQDCPLGGMCRNLDNGYECVANITFNGRNTTLSYVLNHPSVDVMQDISLNTLSMSFRSRIGGTIIYISSMQNPYEYFSVSVLHGEVSILWRLDSNSPGEIKRFHRDGAAAEEWTTVVIHMTDGEISGGFVDSEKSFSSNFSLEAWHKLLSDSRVTLGGGISYGAHDRLDYATEGITVNPIGDYAVLDANSVNLATSVANGENFKGCLGEMRIGGLLLPYFTVEQLSEDNDTSKHAFALEQGEPPTLGCILCFDFECQHKGLCANITDSYDCQCQAGYQGTYCEIDINECEHGECKNDGKCVDGVANYTCNCQPGWDGWLCDVDINECVSNPCMNGGTCNDLIAAFECECTEKYTGIRCENDKLITCDNYPCRNGSTCLNEKNDKTGDNFTCICAKGFEGPHCEDVYCRKVESTCRYGGTCEVVRDVPVCICVPGYTGYHCEQNINECDSGPCQNGGSCDDDVNGFTCNCDGTGYGGEYCDEDIDECALIPTLCVYGKCVNTLGSYKCQCDQGYCGTHCNISDPCEEGVNPCRNDGVCNQACTSVVDYNCECTTGHAGKNCTLQMEEAYGNAVDIAIIVAPIVGFILIAAAIGLSIFISMARKKRATRGTYSPSQQEYCNPRVEMDNVMKPPPEERLI